MLQLCAFTYGCVATVGAVAWCIAVAFGYVALPESVWVPMVVISFHGSVCVVTFDRTPGRRIWKPLLLVTHRRVQIARASVALSVINFAASLVMVFRSEVPANGEVPGALAFVVRSFLLMSSVYVVVHWAFRPENLFPDTVLAAARNPLWWIVGRMRRSSDVPRKR